MSPNASTQGMPGPRHVTSPVPSAPSPGSKISSLGVAVVVTLTGPAGVGTHAVALIEEHGPDGFTLREAARKVGVVIFSFPPNAGNIGTAAFLGVTFGNNKSMAGIFNGSGSGVILRINSPGGSPVQAGIINDAYRNRLAAAQAEADSFGNIFGGFARMGSSFLGTL